MAPRTAPVAGFRVPSALTVPATVATGILQHPAMNDSISAHPDSNDLVNLARERLGKKKTERIIEHCKQCQPCADLLLEAVREHAARGAKLPLTRWQWISIGLFVVALLMVVATMVWFVRGAEQPFWRRPAGSNGLLPANALTLAGRDRVLVSALIAQNSAQDLAGCRLGDRVDEDDLA